MQKLVLKYSVRDIFKGIRNGLEVLCIHERKYSILSLLLVETMKAKFVKVILVFAIS